MQSLNRRRRQQGAALLLVLCVTALLAAMAATLALTTSRSAKIAGGLATRTRLQTVAGSAIEQTLWSLLNGDPGAPQLDGNPHPLIVSGIAVQMVVSDEAGRIDVNESSAELIAALFRAAQASPSEADSIARALVVGRNLQSGSMGKGYEAMIDLWTLQSVKGVTPSLYRAVRPGFTVYTRALSVDQRFASPLVRQALSAVSGSDRSMPFSDEGTTIEGPLMLSGRILRLDVRVALEDGTALSESEIVAMSRGQRWPYQVLDREELD